MIPSDLEADRVRSFAVFVLAAAAVGALTGLIAASFRLLLDHGDAVRDAFAHWAHGNVGGLVLLVLACSAATALAAALVRRIEPDAEGSGIPHVEAVVEGRLPPGRLMLLPVKYVGGLLSIGAGLALGREGPSVQMGSSVAAAIARATRRSPADLRTLAAAGAAAGLATAFNAPIAGGVFVLEELIKRFDRRATVATLVASASGFAVALLVVPSGTVFRLPQLPDPELSDAPWVLAVGVLTGVAGVLYTTSLLSALRVSDRNRLPIEVRAAAIGAAVGVLLWLAPGFAGGGDDLTQQALLGRGAVWVVIGVFALRFALGVVSYAAGTPGGLFAPMLTLGAECGLLVGLVAQHVGSSAPSPTALALIGMAAFFTAVVQAPITGLILATELTGSANQLPPMLGACAVAMLVAIGLRCRPVYDQLTDRAATNP